MRTGWRLLTCSPGSVPETNFPFLEGESHVNTYKPGMTSAPDKISTCNPDRSRHQTYLARPISPFIRQPPVFRFPFPTWTFHVLPPHLNWSLWVLILPSCFRCHSGTSPQAESCLEVNSFHLAAPCKGTSAFRPCVRTRTQKSGGAVLPYFMNVFLFPSVFACHAHSSLSFILFSVFVTVVSPYAAVAFYLVYLFSPIPSCYQQ
ncbi:hypothetical protein B0I37DRAFT_179508 [Chaetomium sp. MPI-CAGE-AT-0009]|nr:hypothetical protein B0I37DRAFT_179508 [Chaetomium sp. MPI-CAGE-AT-0009]